MSEIKRIQSQLRRAFEGQAWHGPSVRELLADVTAEQATARPLPRSHNIWEIVLHIAAWERVVRRRLEGEITGDLPGEEDWPPVRDQAAEAWQQALQALERGHQELREAIALLDEVQLAELAPGMNYSIYFMLHGVIQHDLYHAGQIALLKKAEG